MTFLGIGRCLRNLTAATPVLFGLSWNLLFIANIVEVDMIIRTILWW
jgi:hypothetical protein